MQKRTLHDDNQMGWQVGLSMTPNIFDERVSQFLLKLVVNTRFDVIPSCAKDLFYTSNIKFNIHSLLE